MVEPGGDMTNATRPLTSDEARSKKLEAQADAILAKAGFRKDGRPRKSKRLSVHLIYSGHRGASRRKAA